MSDIDLNKAKRYDQLPMRKIIRNFCNTRNIISYGIMAYAKNTKRWLTVRHTHTYAFIMVIRGAYRDGEIEDLLNEMRLDEVNALKIAIKNDEAMKKMYDSSFMGKCNYIPYMKLRFRSHHLLNSLSDCKIKQTDQEWTWPKGRLSSKNENTFNCALREFKEETCVQLDSKATIFSNSFYSEKESSDSGNTYETRCWLAILDYEIPPSETFALQYEIAEASWLTEAETRQKLPRGKITMLDKALLDIPRMLKSF
jgi:predicted NUDIX family NTP pyrophosphohydrolase